MYRGSRLAASFLLFLTGTAVTAVAVIVIPAAIAPNVSWPIIPLAISFGVAHFIAMFGMARGREWGRSLAVSLAEAGGGLSIALIVALVLGANPFVPAGSGRGDATTMVGLALWLTCLYAVLGTAAGRVRFNGWTRRSAWWPAPLLRVGT